MHSTLSSLPAERLLETRIFLHPSVCFVQSRLPMVTIWEYIRTDDGDGLIERWTAEAADRGAAGPLSRSPHAFRPAAMLFFPRSAKENCGNGRRDRNRSLCRIRCRLLPNAARWCQGGRRY